MAKITFISSIPDETLEKIAIVHGWISEITNPAYDETCTEYIPNPDYNAEDPTSTETILNPEYELKSKLTIPNPESAVNFASLHVLAKGCAEVGVHECTYPEKEDLTPKQFESLIKKIRSDIYTTTIVEVNDIRIN